jgi:sugar lactone lactonase YvrE
MRFRYALPALALLLAPALAAQPTVNVVADGLAGPLGVAVGPDGRVWVAESGTGNDDGRVSVLVDGALQPVVSALPSVGFDGEVDGIAHLLVTDDALWVIGGAGPAPAFDLLRFELSALTPGTPVGADAAAFEANLGAWVLSQGYDESNVYAAAQADDGALLLSDAAANALLRYEPGDRSRSVLATFDPVPTGAAPPVADAVPTGLARWGDGVLVGTLTGFPFADGAASVMEVGLDGAVSTMHNDLTVVTDVALDPRDGRPVALEFARFTPTDGYLPGTGRLVKLLGDGTEEVVADGLNLVAGLAFASDGTAYVTSLFGQLLEVSFAPTAGEGGPAGAGVALAAAPNPFAASTALSFTLTEPSDVRLAVYDALGREVARLADGPRLSGPHTVRLDGAALAAGVYVARLQVGGRTAAATVVRTR